MEIHKAMFKMDKYAIYTDVTYRHFLKLLNAVLIYITDEQVHRLFSTFSFDHNLYGFLYRITSLVVKYNCPRCEITTNCNIRNTV